MRSCVAERSSEIKMGGRGVDDDVVDDGADEETEDDDVEEEEEDCGFRPDAYVNMSEIIRPRE